MKIIILILSLLLSACVTVATNSQGEKLTIRGWGAKKATWEKNGEKSTIEQKGIFKFPNILSFPFFGGGDN